jgi:hypothetical protein
LFKNYSGPVVIENSVVVGAESELQEHVSHIEAAVEAVDEACTSMVA